MEEELMTLADSAGFILSEPQYIRLEGLKLTLPIGDEHWLASIENFWEDLLAIDGVSEILEKYGAKIGE